MKNNFTNLAPIALFVYNRPWHTEQTVKYLQKNELAQESELFIYSDASRNDEDKDSVSDVRTYIKSITGFKKITIIIRKKNFGLAKSIIDGVTKTVNKYGKIIVLEDDLICNKKTLHYFNTLLQEYEINPSVFSISGFNYPHEILPISKNYEFDIYATIRMQCWGWATWQEKWSLANFSMPDYNDFVKSESLTNAYSKQIGQDSLNTLKSYMQGKRDVWASRWVFTHFKFNGLCICPVQSLINNIGLDGSGSNCKSKNKYENQVDGMYLWPLRLPPFPFIEQNIHHDLISVTNPRSNHFLKILKKMKKYLKQIKHIFGRTFIKLSHEYYLSKSSNTFSYLGTKYGGWWTPDEGISEGDYVISAGAGEDISFDIELVKKFSVNVLVIDPTPRAIKHFDKTTRFLSKSLPAPINNNQMHYQLEPQLLKHLKFIKKGIWDKNTTIWFHSPANNKHVSHSIVTSNEQANGFEADVITLDTIMDMYSVNSLAILKLDIEGAEYTVLQYLINTTIRPKFILVEFHPGNSYIQRLLRLNVLNYIHKLKTINYKLVNYQEWDYVFEYIEN